MYFAEVEIESKGADDGGVAMLVWHSRPRLCENCTRNAVRKDNQFDKSNKKRPEFREFIGLIPLDDLALMKRVIEDDCERIDDPEEEDLRWR